MKRAEGEFFVWYYPFWKYCRGKSEGLFFGEETFFIICAVLCSVAQMFLTLCDPMDCSWPGSSVYGDSPGKNTGVDCKPSSRGYSQSRNWTQVSCIEGGFFTNWATREAQEYWSGYTILSSLDLPDPGIKLGSPALQADSLPAELPGKPFLKSKNKTNGLLRFFSPWAISLIL